MINLYVIGDTLYIHSFPLNFRRLFENVNIFFSIAFMLIKNLKSSLKVLITVGLYPSLFMFEFRTLSIS
ncbi:conserved hypothetical protein, partial (plasmid) [Borreliella spielmanii A14S]